MRTHIPNAHQPFSTTFWPALLVVWIVGGCTTTARTQHTLRVLENPVQVRTEGISLTVGRNRWTGENIQVTEFFLPIAVTVRNTGTQPLCGGAATATLSDSTGTSASAVFPENVAARLLGPLASYSLPVLPSVSTTIFKGTPAIRLQRVGGVWGAYSGLPGSFGPGPVWGPGGFRGGFGGGFGSGFGGGGFPSPFYGPHYGPFYDPWPPFGGFPYLHRLPPVEETPQRQPEETKAYLLQEIFSVAFASRPLTVPEERTGFLFFPLPTSETRERTLTWDWYDCTTKVLVAHLTVPIVDNLHQ